MKKFFSIIALVFVVCAAQAQAPSQEFVDGVILRTSFVDGDEVAYIDVNGDFVWDQRINVRRIANAYGFDCHAFRRGRTISEAICIGLWQLQRDLIISRGENPANYGYGYGYYGSGAAMYSALRTASGGIYLNMGGFRLNLGLFRGLDGITRVSVGGGTRHIGGGVTVPIQKKNKVQSAPAQRVQVQSQPQAQETVKLGGKTYNVVKKTPAELREMMRRK